MDTHIIVTVIVAFCRVGR